MKKKLPNLGVPLSADDESTSRRTAIKKQSQRKQRSKKPQTIKSIRVTPVSLPAVSKSAPLSESDSRSHAAKKAAATRAAKEAALTPEARESLRNARRYNLARSLKGRRGDMEMDGIIFNPDTGVVRAIDPKRGSLDALPTNFPTGEDIPDELDGVLDGLAREIEGTGLDRKPEFDVDEIIGTISRIENPWRYGALKELAELSKSRIIYAVNKAIITHGKTAVAKRLAAQSSEVIELAQKIMYSSDSEEIEFHVGRLLEIVNGGPLALHEALIFEE